MSSAQDYVGASSPSERVSLIVPPSDNEEEENPYAAQATALLCSCSVVYLAELVASLTLGAIAMTSYGDYPDCAFNLEFWLAMNGVLSLSVIMLYLLHNSLPESCPGFRSVFWTVVLALIGRIAWVLVGSMWMLNADELSGSACSAAHVDWIVWYVICMWSVCILYLVPGSIWALYLKRNNVSFKALIDA